MSNLDTFNSRINRISRGKQWAPDGVVHQPVRTQMRKGRHGPVARFFHTISLPIAFSLGFLAMAISRFARLKISGVPEGGGVLTETLMIDATVALVLAFILVQIVSMRTVAQVMVSVAGVGVAAMGMHMVVHRAPEVFAQFFGPDWVNSVLASTEPNAVLFSHLLQRLPV